MIFTTSEIFCDKCNKSLYRRVGNTVEDNLKRVTHHVPVKPGLVNTEQYCPEHAPEIICECWRCTEMKGAQ